MLLQSNTRNKTDLAFKLYSKAKSEPLFRFYSLYDKVYSFKTLWQAWTLVRRDKDTSPGVDGITVEAVEKSGEKVYVEQIRLELLNGSYLPSPLKPSYLAKAGGGKRLIGIPTLKDRVIQRAVSQILAPIFEADFLPCSYGYRPNVGQHDAIRSVARYIRQGYLTAYSADIQNFFDNISHHIVMTLLRRRIADNQVLKLIQCWMTAPIGMKGERRNGIQQGGPISPLLANIVLNEIDRAWYKPEGPFQQFKAPLIRYADDILVMMHTDTPKVAETIKRLLEPLQLELSHEKSKLIKLNNGQMLHFLGFGISVSDGGTGGAKVSLRPQQKKTEALKAKVREIIKRNSGNDRKKLLGELLPLTRGFRSYFYFYPTGQ